MLNIPLPFSHITSKFVFDGKQYDIEDFKISFNQPVDYKGQPENEKRGGQLIVTIKQAANSSLYLWAKKSTMLKSGQVLFQTDLGISVLKISFSNAYCINLSRNINASTGTTTTLVITPENITMNGVTHENFWPK